MPVLRSLRRIIRNHSYPKPRPFLTSLSLSSPSPSPSSSIPRPFHLISRDPVLSPPHSRYLSPLSDLNGPLFLSSPPSKLSQSATPLLVQSDVVLPPRLDDLKLLQMTKFGLPIKLGSGKQNGGRRDSDREDTLPRKAAFNSWMIVNEWYLPAFVGLAVSGATDWLDGFLARRMGINSILGSYLDPLADKVLVGCVALAMVEKNLLHSGLVGMVVLRDVMLVGGAVCKRASSLNWQWKSSYDFFNLDGTHPEKVEPLFISKEGEDFEVVESVYTRAKQVELRVNTVFQLVLVAAALLQPEFGTPETESYITYLSWLVASTTVASTTAYGVQHLRNRSSIFFPRSH